jgi:hypothetical protein
MIKSTSMKVLKLRTVRGDSGNQLDTFEKFTRKLPLIVIAAFFLVAMGCSNQGRGLVLPEGDVEKGKSDFVALSCNNCHTVGDITWNGEESVGDVKVDLGGEVTSIKTYGELVTSIINPSHDIARRYRQETANSDGTSKMENYNQVMTVEELVNLVTYLQTEYKITVPRNTYYY